MKEENKLLVFDKKEVLLVLLLALCLFLGSFIFGVKVGKEYSFSNSGVEKEEVETLEILAGKEEEARDISKKNSNPVSKQQSYDLLKRKIEEELKKTKISTDEPLDEIKGQQQVIPEKEIAETNSGYYESNMATNEADKVEPKRNEAVDAEVMASVYKDKWTIQLSSHKNLKDAKIFANNFKVRGYDPIINEVNLGNKGTWFRVSLGAFDTLVDAKNYVISEEEVFSDVDHVFIQFE